MSSAVDGKYLGVAQFQPVNVVARLDTGSRDGNQNALKSSNTKQQSVNTTNTAARIRPNGRKKFGPNIGPYLNPEVPKQTCSQSPDGSTQMPFELTPPDPDV